MKHRRASQKSSDTVIFTPHSLPCGYNVVDRMHLETDGQVEEQVTTYNVLGPFFRVQFDVDDGALIEELVLRPDINIPDPDSDKIYIEEFHGVTIYVNGTENLLVELGDVDSALDEYLDWYLNPWEFLNKTTGSHYGKKCQIFYDYDEEENIDVYVYADMDNYIFGLNASGEGYLELHNMTYSFKTNIHSFVLNKKLFYDCNDSRAFNPPNVPDPCNSSSFTFLAPPPAAKEPTRFVLTGSVVFLAVIGALVTAAFFLF